MMGLPNNQLATSAPEELTTRIVSAVSNAKDTDPLSLPPLGETVDICALQTFVEGVDDSMSISFTYRGVRVNVRGDGSVTVGENSSGG